MSPCLPGAHVHPMASVLVFRGWAVFIDLAPVVLCTDRTVADRVADLINRHGLGDWPDDIGGLLT